MPKRSASVSASASKTRSRSTASKSAAPARKKGTTVKKGSKKSAVTAKKKAGVKKTVASKSPATRKPAPKKTKTTSAAAAAAAGSDATAAAVTKKRKRGRKDMRLRHDIDLQATLQKYATRIQQYEPAAFERLNGKYIAAFSIFKKSVHHTAILYQTAIAKGATPKGIADVSKRAQTKISAPVFTQGLANSDYIPVVNNAPLDEIVYVGPKQQSFVLDPLFSVASTDQVFLPPKLVARKKGNPKISAAVAAEAAAATATAAATAPTAVEPALPALEPAPECVAAPPAAAAAAAVVVPMQVDA